MAAKAWGAMLLAVSATASIGVAQTRSLDHAALRLDPTPRFDPTTPLRLVNGRAQWVDYRGRQALHLMPLEGQERATDQEISALIVGSDFGDGTIEVDVSGARRAGYPADDRSAFKGFVGVSFRVRGDSAERFYLRPENARLDDQLFRNRVTQYESTPAFPWQVLRRESPGLYESYADVEAGAWTTIRIEVQGDEARLYLNGAFQPALVVNDLKHGKSRGAIALWTRVSADAYFSNLRVVESVSLNRELPVVERVVNGRAEPARYRGVDALHLVPSPEAAGRDTVMLAMLAGADFKDGTIQLAVAGAPRPGADTSARGFIGLSFRTGPKGEWSEVFYLRPSNGRADDQRRRNHSVQYVFDPEYPWHRLRRDDPGRYESSADLEVGAWTPMRIEVAGTTARLYLNGAREPALVVTDLKGGDRSGRIALWAHVDTDGYFGPIVVTAR